MDLLEASERGGPWGLVALGTVVVKYLHSEKVRLQLEVAALRREAKKARLAHMRDLRELRSRGASRPSP